MDGLPDSAPPPPQPQQQQQQKRDEWSESGISRLLGAYEAKWLLRNRAKLKWSDWVDIANDVSAHCASEAGKPGGGAKTPNQCKNKVESMKKRYRAESAAAARAGASPGPGGGTSWRFFGRMDGLLKGPAATGCSGQVQTEPTSSISADLRAVQPAKAEIDVDVEADIPGLRQLPDVGLPTGALSDLLNAEANGSATEKAEKVDQITQKEAADSDAANGVSSPRSKEEANDGGAEEVDDVPSRKRKGSELDVARSIELLASSFVKIEQARMEMYRETERMRAEAEIKKGEMELKRTEIMAKTQLQIARLFAKRLKECSGGKNGGSSSEVDGLTKKCENGVVPVLVLGGNLVRVVHQCETLPSLLPFRIPCMLTTLLYPSIIVYKATCRRVCVHCYSHLVFPLSFSVLTIGPMDFRFRVNRQSKQLLFPSQKQADRQLS